MKKILYMTLALAAFCTVVSCSSGSSGPGEAAKHYAEYLVDGNVDKYLDGISYGENATKEEIEQSKAMFKGLISEKFEPTLEEKGGMKSIDIVSETIAEDGQSASVVLKQTFGNGETEEQTCKMVLVDGKWLMKIDK